MILSGTYPAAAPLSSDGTKVIAIEHAQTPSTVTRRTSRRCRATNEAAGIESRMATSGSAVMFVAMAPRAPVSKRWRAMRAVRLLTTFGLVSHRVGPKGYVRDN